MVQIANIYNTYKTKCTTHIKIILPAFLAAAALLAVGSLLSPPQELEVGTHRVPYLLVLI